MTQKELETQIKQCADYIQICKLQSTYSHYHHCCMFDKIPSLFAQKTDGIEIEDMGVFEGPTAARSVFFERMG